jgi:amidophosphoribosyltransferase
MCGILGIIDKKEAVFERTVLGLMALQHRGQDACGILTNEGKEFFLKKKKDTVGRAFKETDSKKLVGNISIGHTRYPTLGSLLLSDSQPLYVNSSRKVAMAQNGNVTNYFDLKKELTKKGMFLTTTVDAEPILLIFAEDYEKNNDFFKASEQVLKKVRGAYSLVGTIADKGLFAIRDPHGIRPLVLGKNGNSYAFASETVALQTMGYDYVRDIEPGEAVFISKDLGIESKILIQKKRAHCMFEWLYFADPTSMIEGRSVYKARLALGVLMNKQVNREDYDVLIPVPDSGRTCATKLAEVSEIKYREGLIKDKYVGRTFIMSSQKMRERNVMLKLKPIKSIIGGNRILLVDDSIVRGTTSKRIVQLLKNNGATEVSFASSCPPIKYPCFYGVDMHTQKDLIAANKTLEEIRESMQVKQLVYATIDDVKKAIRRDVCLACLDGIYPEEISEEQKQSLSGQRSTVQKEKEVLNK